MLVTVVTLFEVAYHYVKYFLDLRRRKLARNMIRNLIGNLDKPKDPACFKKFMACFWEHAVSLGLSRFPTRFLIMFLASFLGCRSMKPLFLRVHNYNGANTCRPPKSGQRME
jgi:hypothetical protein